MANIVVGRSNFLGKIVRILRSVVANVADVERRGPVIDVVSISIRRQKTQVSGGALRDFYLERVVLAPARGGEFLNLSKEFCYEASLITSLIDISNLIEEVVAYRANVRSFHG